MNDEVYYWLAVNGPSCAMCGMPARSVTVVPTPEQLIGFPTHEEAMAAQQVMLTEPIEQVQEYLQTFVPRIGKDMAYERPDDPQPPTDTTVWIPKGQHDA